jgi:hypothetical protein
LAPILKELLYLHKSLEQKTHLQLWLRGDFEGISAEVATMDYSQPDYYPTRLSIIWCE